ncbi:MAG: YgaP family membrane protein [Bacteriovorax sp.]
MVKNINDPERVVRLLVGALITSLAFWGPRNFWFLLGIVPMATGFVGTCPLYLALGISTIHRKKMY